MEVFLESRKIEEALLNRNVQPCLTWCHENKTKLKKIDVRCVSSCSSIVSCHNLSNTVLRSSCRKPMSGVFISVTLLVIINGAVPAWGLSFSSSNLWTPSMNKPNIKTVSFSRPKSRTRIFQSCIACTMQDTYVRFVTKNKGVTFDFNL